MLQPALGVLDIIIKGVLLLLPSSYGSPIIFMLRSWWYMQREGKRELRGIVT